MSAKSAMRLFPGSQPSLGDTHPDLRLFDPAPGTIVVLPSITLPEEVLQRLVGMPYYEERMLWLLLALARPDTRVVYLSSLHIDPDIVDYYLDFLPNPEQGRARLRMLHLADDTPRPLTEKLLGRPDIIEQLRVVVSEPGGGWIQPFIVTSLEQRFAEQIGLPLYGAHPSLAYLGTKSGARRVARAVQVPILRGKEDLRSLSAVENALRVLKASEPPVEQAVIKLDDSSSGLGNVIVNITQDESPITKWVTRFTTGGENWQSFERKLTTRGAAAEQLLQHDNLASPSALVEITPQGKWYVLATHEQILGGANGQTYLGCRFPADIRYRDCIQRYAERVAESLAGRGVIGSFGIDFLVIPSAVGECSVYLTEINLRLGGTTHPLGMIVLSTEGSYSRSMGELTAQGHPKYYVATDNLILKQLIGATPWDVLALLRKAGLAFERYSGTGVAAHMLGALPQFGKLGLTCIGHSPTEADQLYRDAVQLLETWVPPT